MSSFPPYLWNELYKSCTGKCRLKLFSPVVFDREVPVSWLAIMVLLGSEVQDGTQCDAEPKGQDSLRQSGTCYSLAHVPGEEEEYEKSIV